MKIPASLEVSEPQYRALELLASHGGSLPGAILNERCFGNSAACTRAMNHLHRVQLVARGRYQCYSQMLRSQVYYAITPEGMGLVTTGENIYPRWLSNASDIRFNLICQETRYQAEAAGWEWLSEPKTLLVALARKGIVWARIEGHWPLFGIQRGGRLWILWILWQGLTLPQLDEWQRLTRELRQKELLLAVALRPEVAREIAKRLASRGIHCSVMHLQQLQLP